MKSLYNVKRLKGMELHLIADWLGELEQKTREQAMNRRAAEIARERRKGKRR